QTHARSRYKKRLQALLLLRTRGHPLRLTILSTGDGRAGSTRLGAFLPLGQCRTPGYRAYRVSESSHGNYSRELSSSVPPADISRNCTRRQRGAFVAATISQPQKLGAHAQLQLVLCVLRSNGIANSAA